MILRSEPASPDAWVVLAAGGSVLALPVADSARLGGLGERLVTADGFRAVLEALTGQGISAAPSFAIVDATIAEAVRIVLRGDAEVATASGAFDGRGVTTWTERVIEGGGSLRLTVPGSAWTFTLGTGAPAFAAAPPTGETAVEVATLVPKREEPVSEPHDFLFGDPGYRSSEGEPVRIPDPAPKRPGDHDGRTVLAGDLGLGSREPERPAAVAGPPPTVSLELPDGRIEPVTRPVLIGRSPSAGRVTGAGLPRLLTIAADDKDISRTHARVEVQGGAVIVTDLDSKNGTLVTVPGEPARKLRGGDPAVVLPGTVIDLGGGVTMTVREE